MEAHIIGINVIVSQPLAVTLFKSTWL